MMETVKELESYFVRNLGYMIDALNDKDDMSSEEIKEYKAAKRLIEICQAERDGRCVVLPCSVGEKIWTIENVFNGKEVARMLGNRIIDEIQHNKLNKNTMISKQPFELHFYPSEVGKTVFLTREEAEEALKEANHE